MNPLTERLEAVKDAFAAAQPHRIVTRKFVDFADRPTDELAKGVYTIVSQGERDFTNVAGYTAQDGTQDLVIVGQIELAGDSDGVQVEDAELDMVEEVKAFCRSLPESLCQLDFVAFRQSQQLEAPYGWIACSLEYRP